MTLRELHTAGAVAFNSGKPCVPGLCSIWHLSISGPQHGPQSIRATAFAQVWRTGWRSQAARVERVRPCDEMAFDGFTFTPCGLPSRHEGECR